MTDKEVSPEDGMCEFHRQEPIGNYGRCMGKLCKLWWCHHTLVRKEVVAKVNPVCWCPGDCEYCTDLVQGKFCSVSCSEGPLNDYVASLMTGNGDEWKAYMDKRVE